MSLEDFCNASYALLVEEHQRINPFKDLMSLAEEVTPRPSGKPQARTTVASSNQQAMEMLTGQMGAIQGSPLRKPRRAR